MALFEITALTVGDLRLDDRPLIAVTKAWADVGGTLVPGPTKGGENRTVPVPSLLEARLKEAVDGRARGELVFRSAKGRELRNNLFARPHYKPAIAAAAGNDADSPTQRFTVSGTLRSA